MVGGEDQHHRRQHDPLPYILFSADGRTTSSSLYICLMKFPWKIPDSLSNIDSSHCGSVIVINHSGMIVIKSLFRICSLAWLLCVQWDSNFFCTAVPFLYEWGVLVLTIPYEFIMTSYDWCSFSVILEEEEFYSEKAVFVLFFCISSSKYTTIIFLFPSIYWIQNKALNLSYDLYTSWWVG